MRTLWGELWPQREQSAPNNLRSTAALNGTPFAQWIVFFCQVDSQGKMWAKNSQSKQTTVKIEGTTTIGLDN